MHLTIFHAHVILFWCLSWCYQDSIEKWPDSLQLIDWLIDLGLIEWLIDWLMDWSIDWSIDWLIDWLIVDYVRTEYDFFGKWSVGVICNGCWVRCLHFGLERELMGFTYWHMQVGQKSAQLFQPHHDVPPRLGRLVGFLHERLPAAYHEFDRPGSVVVSGETGRVVAGVALQNLLETGGVRPPTIALYQSKHKSITCLHPCTILDHHKRSIDSSTGGHVREMWLARSLQGEEDLRSGPVTGQVQILLVLRKQVRYEQSAFIKCSCILLLIIWFWLMVDWLISWLGIFFFFLDYLILIDGWLID